jgi:hypothetical protein
MGKIEHGKLSRRLRIDVGLIFFNYSGFSMAIAPPDAGALGSSSQEQPCQG